MEFQLCAACFRVPSHWSLSYSFLGLLASWRFTIHHLPFTNVFHLPTMGLIETIRKWIDGETAQDLLESADEHAKPRRIWEEFLVKIAREVEAVMQREMFTPPGGLTYIPREYVVYLSADDDKDWQGDKRRGLEQGLFHVLSERAKELSGSTQLAAKSFAVELRVDGTLNKGEFRVQAVWDETEAGHTMVTVRPATTATGTSIAPAAAESE